MTSIRHFMQIVESAGDESGATPAARLVTEIAPLLEAASLSHVEVALTASDAMTCTLDAVWNHQSPARGDASRAMRMVTALADQLGVTIKLEVHFLRYDTEHGDYDPSDLDRLDALNDQYLRNKQLIAWYGRLGFVRDATNDPDEDENITMTRLPRTT